MEISLINNQKSIFNPTQQISNSSSSMYKGSNKTFVFDINQIQNKLSGSSAELKTPSTRAYQQQLELRQKNYQSDIIKQTLSQPNGSGNSTTMALNNKLQQLRQNNVEQIISFKNPILQQRVSNLYGTFSSTEKNKNEYTSNHIENQQSSGNKFKVSQRSSMYDFRKQTLSSNNILAQQNQTSSHRQSSYQGRQQQEQLLQPSDPYKQQQFNQNPYNTSNTLIPQFRPLTPIKENDQARITDIVPPSRSVMDPDNNILFLDNGSRVINPTNVKTPPPPMWGEILEEENFDPNEDFYDHQKAMEEAKKRKIIESKQNRIMSQNGKKLKKKIVYVYESDSDKEDENKNKIAQYENISQKDNLTKSLISMKPNEDISNKNQFQIQSRRGYSNDGIYRNNQFQNSNTLNLNAYGLPPQYQTQNNRNTNNQKTETTLLPSIKQNINGNFNRDSIKPPLPSSQLKMINGNGMPASRQIRTGGFQKLPTIALLQKQI